MKLEVEKWVWLWHQNRNKHVAEWSYNAVIIYGYKAFEQCPTTLLPRAKVLKKFHEQSEEAKRGDKDYKAFENFIKWRYSTDYAEPFRDWVEVFAEQEGDKHAEFKIAMDWQAKKEATSGGKNIWIRGQFDLLVDQGEHAVMIDANR